MSQTVKVTLSTPIKRGDTSITELMLRKPKAGELRGLSLLQIQMCDVTTHIKLIPRIASPMVTEADIADLEADDLSEVMDGVVGFFLTKEQNAQAGTFAQPEPQNALSPTESKT
ncbi:phage tail protein E family protein [Asticcacaulis biprosthecium C19]|uniref:Phage tail protein E family protein n=1 Tax=Asticcacaulis biprosthecium C19 TaxID=715226 RepID=F4QJB5_9CAUL|nr:phage tail assembly protein [Asticcacaulis biprosthecium]EGF93098.1 phage tail protein E family protein [Asticcacaulis biprosthecium C19]